MDIDCPDVPWEEDCSEALHRPRKDHQHETGYLCMATGTRAGKRHVRGNQDMERQQDNKHPICSLMLSTPYAPSTSVRVHKQVHTEISPGG